MKARILGRVLWKEWRVQRGFMLAVLGSTLLVMAWFHGALVLTPDSLSGLLRSAAFTAAVLHALGCGAMLVALERERETETFQRALPGPWPWIAAGKAAFAILSASVVALILVGAAIAFGGRTPAADIAVFGGSSGSTGPGLMVLVLEALAWAVIASAHVSAVVTGVLLAAIAFSVSDAILAPTLGTVLQQVVPANTSPFAVEQTAHVLLIACAGVTTGILLRTGFRNRSSGKAAKTGRRERDTGIPRAHRFLNEARSVEQRLVWQQWHAGKGLFVPAAALSLLALAWFWRVFPAYPSQLIPLFPFIMIALCVIPPAVFGTITFQSDHHRHCFRFLAHRGVRPKPLWLSRQAIPALWTLGWTVLCTATAWAIITKYPPHWPSRQLPPVPQSMPLLAAPVAVLTVTAYAAGQFCSQCIRNGLLSCLLGVTLAGILCTWVLTMLASPVVLSWVVWVIPVILLALTFTWTPSWLEERRPWGHHAYSAAALVTPCLLLTAGIATQRVLEFPPVDAVLVAEDRAPPTDALTAMTAMSLYQRASDILSQFYHSAWQTHLEEQGNLQAPEPGSRDEVQMRQQEAARLVEEAGNLLLGAPVTSDDGAVGSLLQWDRGDRRIRLGKGVLNAAAEARSDGDLDLAWRRCLAVLRWSVSLAHPDADRHLRGSGMYLYREVLLELCRWAAEPAQTSALLDDATRTVEALVSPIPAPHRNAVQAYRALLNAVCVPGTALSDWSGYPNYLASAAMRLVPWEMARLRRNVAKAAEGELAFWQLLETRVSDSPTGYWDDFRALTDISQTLPLHRHDPVQAWLLDTWINTTTYQRTQGLGVNRRWYSVDEAASDVLSAITLRRAWRLAMAIHQWRVEHGRLPTSLEELGPDFVPPVSARDGRPILYAPRGAPGLPKPDQWRQQIDTNSGRRRIRATPYLLCPSQIAIDLSPHPVWIRAELGE